MDVFRLLLLILLLAPASPASVAKDPMALAATEATFVPDKSIDRCPEPQLGSLSPSEGGETIETATVIPSLPYEDAGSTCGHVNDYDESCPYEGSTSPDLVYQFMPASEMVINIDLCASSFDTKVYVYEAPYFDDPIACNDDAGCGYSGWQSRIDVLCLFAGRTYYIVVDGYGGDCGDYLLTMSEYACCIVDCPPHAVMENEPDCVDGYEDAYNAGCTSSPPSFVLLQPPSEDRITFCGWSCTFTTGDEPQFDEDWFEIYASDEDSEPVLLDVMAETPVTLTIATGDCGQFLIIESCELQPCDPYSFHLDAIPVQRFMIGITATVDNCWGGGHYVLDIRGISQGPTSSTPLTPRPASQTSSWGRLKFLYRE